MRIHAGAAGTSIPVPHTFIADKPLESNADILQVEADVVPRAIELRGRTRSYEELNGVYKLMDSWWAGKPAYAQLGSEHMPDALFLYYSGGYWVVARELCSMPKAIARRYTTPESRHPLTIPAEAAATGREHVWEFLHGESHMGLMVTVDTRTYSPDFAVSLCACGGQAATYPPVVAAGGSNASGAFAPVAASKEQNPSCAAPLPCAAWPAWVSSAIAHLADGEVRAAVIVQQSVPVDFNALGIDVNSKLLKVHLDGHQELELQLPVEVNVDQRPQAKWSDRRKTLRIRLSLLS